MRHVVGVLGGTFNPVHMGHVVMAQECRRRLGLERVLLVPCATPPHKSAPRGATLADRIAMLELAASNETGLEVSRIEAHAGVVCYTIDTLRRMRHGGWNLEPVFVMGADSLRDLTTWKDYLALLAEFDLVVLERGSILDQWDLDGGIVERILPVGDRAAVPPDVGRGGRVLLLDVEPPSVSSREIRRRAADGGDLSGLVPPGVARYIRDNLLYQEAEEEER